MAGAENRGRVQGAYSQCIVFVMLRNLGYGYIRMGAAALHVPLPTTVAYAGPMQTQIIRIIFGITLFHEG
jgi:hypothetical protein